MEISSEKSKILKFVKKHHVLTLASCADNAPYCSNMFYAPLDRGNEFFLVFVSDGETRHMREIMQNRLVAGSIVLETGIIGKIQGLQFCGTARELSGDLKTEAKRAYIRRFPYAAVLDAAFRAIDVEYAKLTDNRLGFGKKIVWKKSG